MVELEVKVEVRSIGYASVLGRLRLAGGHELDEA
jgi:hypothetical protein